MRCLIVDDDPLDRDLVLRLVSKAGHAPTTVDGGSEAVDRVKGEKFDVALVDLGMQGMDGVATIRSLRSVCPDLRLLVVTSYDDRAHVIDAMTAGADGYVLKTELADRLGSALTELEAGGGPLSAKIARFLIEELRRTPEGTQPGGAKASLSRREWDVLQGLAKGYTYAEIAKDLSISVNTVRHHIRNLYEKLDVCGKAEAVTRALGGLDLGPRSGDSDT